MIQSWQSQNYPFSLFLVYVRLWFWHSWFFWGESSCGMKQLMRSKYFWGELVACWGIFVRTNSSKYSLIFFWTTKYTFLNDSTAISNQWKCRSGFCTNSANIYSSAAGNKYVTPSNQYTRIIFSFSCSWGDCSVFYKFPSAGEASKYTPSGAKSTWEYILISSLRRRKYKSSTSSTSPISIWHSYTNFTKYTNSSGCWSEYFGYWKECYPRTSAFLISDGSDWVGIGSWYCPSTSADHRYCKNTAIGT